MFVTGGIGGVHRHGEQSKIRLFTVWNNYFGEGWAREDTFIYKLEREKMIDTKTHVMNKIRSEIWRRTKE